jgi:OPT oligopeptide transporter protein
MPILSSSVFDNKGQPYDVSKILTPDFLFDKEAYQRYSRVFLPITYVLSYGLQFAALAALITHTACWHWRDIWRQSKRSLKEAKAEKMGNNYQPLPTTSPTAAGQAQGRPSRKVYRRRQSTSSNPGLDNLMGVEDVHCRLMRRYKDAPISWYLITFFVMTAVGIFVVE